MKTRIRFALVGLVMVAVLGLWQVLTGDTIFRQNRNLEKAAKHVPLVRERLDVFPEFQHLRVGSYTGSGGALLVEGTLASEEEIQRMKAIVTETKPPVEVVFHVEAPGEEPETP